MKQPILTTLALFFMVCAVGCQKDHTPTPDDNAKISILFLAPIENSVFHDNDTIPISVKVATDTEVHGYSLYLTNRVHDTVYSKEVHGHEKQFDFTDNYVANVTNNDTLKLEFNLIISHDGSKKTATKTIYINQ